MYEPIGSTNKISQEQSYKLVTLIETLHGIPFSLITRLGLCNFLRWRNAKDFMCQITEQDSYYYREIYNFTRRLLGSEQRKLQSRDRRLWNHLGLSVTSPISSL